MELLVDQLSSFMFVDNEEVITLTCIWRAITMLNHTVVTFCLCRLFAKSPVENISIWLTFARILSILFLILCVTLNDDIQRGFAKSAIGHIGYMSRRVFELVQYQSDRSNWEINKLPRLALSLDSITSVESFSLVVFSVYLMWLRFVYY